MRLAVRITEDRGSVTATLIGNPLSSATAPSKDGALSALELIVDRQYRNGKYEWVEFHQEPEGLLALAGKYRDDPSMMEICDEAYRLRDEEKRLEFGECGDCDYVQLLFAVVE